VVVPGCFQRSDVGEAKDQSCSRSQPKGCSPEEPALKNEQAEQVRAAIESLSADQQTVVRKRIYEGLKFREIAEELDVPLGTILARMQAALKKLKPFFE